MLGALRADLCSWPAERQYPPTQQSAGADCGFGDQKLFAFLGELGFGYVIRFPRNIRVADATGETRLAAD